MNKDVKIYIASHRSQIDSALVRRLDAKGYHNLIVRTHDELDLLEQATVLAFLAKEKSEYVSLAATKVGGIHANNTYPVEFIPSKHRNR